MFDTEDYSLKAGFEGEGNYASTTVSNTGDQKTDQGLTLSPKIQSENPYSLDLDSITHEDIERWLGPLELEMIPEEMEQDDSWIQDIFNEPDQPDPEPPTKRRKLSTPVVSLTDEDQMLPLVEAVDPSSTESYRFSQSLHPGDTTFERDPSILVDALSEPVKSRQDPPRAEPVAPDLQHTELNLQEDGLEIDGSRQACSKDISYNFQAPSATSLPLITQFPHTTCDPPYRSPYPTVQASSHTARTISPTPYTDALLQRHYSSLQNNAQPLQITSIHSAEAPSSIASHGQEQQESFDFGDDGSLFGDDEFEEPTSPSFSMANSINSSIPGTQYCPPLENVVRPVSTRSSSISNSPSQQIKAIPSVAYPSPSMSPVMLDMPAAHLEEPLERSFSHREASLLKDYVNTFCKIPYISKKTALQYARERGFYKTAQPSKETNSGASMNGLARNSSSDLPPKNNSREENILRLISSHLRAKLATTSSTPHTVPADLIKLFESLERKFDQDVNFRNSVLTWAIGKVEAIEKDQSTTHTSSVQNTAKPTSPKEQPIPDRPSEDANMEQLQTKQPPRAEPPSREHSPTENRPVEPRARNDSSNENQPKQTLPTARPSLPSPPDPSIPNLYLSPYPPLQPPPEPSTPNLDPNPYAPSIRITLPSHLPVETRLDRAIDWIQNLQAERLEMKAKIANLQKYAGYLECVNRNLPRPID